MNDLMSIPCVLMRGGTSKGPFFLSSDLPSNSAERDVILLSSNGLRTSSSDRRDRGRAIRSRARWPLSDPPALLARMLIICLRKFGLISNSVDTSPNCGNMLAAVGPFAIEAGLVAATGPLTRVRIHNVNTGKLIEAEVPTPGGKVAYLGDAAIDGVPGLGGADRVDFYGCSRCSNGKTLPHGKRT